MTDGLVDGQHTVSYRLRCETWASIFHECLSYRWVERDIRLHSWHNEPIFGYMMDRWTYIIQSVHPSLLGMGVNISRTFCVQMGGEGQIVGGDGRMSLFLEI